MLERLWVLIIALLSLTACSLDINVMGKTTSPSTSDDGMNFPLGSRSVYFAGPADTATLSDGKTVIIDTMTNGIVILDPSGKALSKFGKYGSGDGQFYLAQGIAVDSEDNFYVADSGNSRIQKFSSDGTHLLNIGTTGTAAGSKLTYPQGIAIDSEDNIYVTDCYGAAVTANYVKKYEPNGNLAFVIGGPMGWNDGELYCPRGLAIDKYDNFYVSEVYNARVQKFDSDGNFLLKFGSAGTAPGQFNNQIFINGSWSAMSPAFSDMAISPDDILFVAEQEPVYRIQRFDLSGNYLGAVGTGIGLSDGELQNPQGLSIDKDGRLEVSDLLQNTVTGSLQKFNTDGTFYKRVRSGRSDPGMLSAPTGTAIYKNEFIVTVDQFNKRASIYSYTGTWIKDFGSFILPTDVAVDGSGSIYVLDVNTTNYQSTIYKFDKDGLVGLPIVITSGGSPITMSLSYGFHVTSSGEIYIADTTGANVKHLSSTGEVIETFGNLAGTDDDMSYPADVTVDSQGRVYVAELMSQIHVYNPNLTHYAIGGTGDFSQFIGIAVNSAGDIITADNTTSQIRKYTMDSGGVISYVGAFGATGDTYKPFHLEFDSKDYLYISDNGNSRILKLDSTGAQVQ